MEKETTTLDNVLDRFSVFGRYHLQLMGFLMFAFFTSSFLEPAYIFAVEKTEYRCTDKAFINNTCGVINGERCSEWIYDIPHGFIAEFQLACQEWKATLVGTFHIFGYMVGLPIVGALSDKIGRKQAIILTGVGGGIIGFLKSFSNSYWMFCAMEFLGSISDCYLSTFVLSLEITSAKKRVMFHYFCSFGNIAGGVLAAAAAWGVPYWRNYLRVVYAPSLLLFAICLIDESPRWLLIKGQKEKAVAGLQKMARQNKVSFKKDELENLIVGDEVKNVPLSKLLQMTLRSRALLKRCLVCIVWWTTSTFVAYGTLINSVSLPGNKFINYALLHMVDIPEKIILMYILNNYKRKSPLIVTFFAAAALCFVNVFLPRGLAWLSILTYVLSKLMNSFYFSITYIYTSELFPTYTRNSMQALCSSLGRIGGILASQTPLLLAYWGGLPMLIFGLASLVAGLVTFLVPDTAHAALPDTVTQAERIGDNNKPAARGVDNLGMTMME